MYEGAIGDRFAIKAGQFNDAMATDRNIAGHLDVVA